MNVIPSAVPAADPSPPRRPRDVADLPTRELASRTSQGLRRQYPSAAYLMLHRAGCATISGEPARGRTFTGGEYTKVCGSREELEDFAGQLGGQTAPCGLRPAACACDKTSPGRGTGLGAAEIGSLGVHLAGHAGSHLQMSFAQIEALVGPLPGSARLHRAWWSNGSGIQSRAWREAGWRVSSVDQGA